MIAAPMSHTRACERCVRKLGSTEQTQTLCFRCASMFELHRISDRVVWRTLDVEAMRLPPWWRWAFFLGFALDYDWTIAEPIAEPYSG